MIMLQLRFFAAPSSAASLGLDSLVESASILRGCLGCKTYRSLSHSTELLYTETWTDWNALNHRVRGSQFRRILQLMEVSTEKPEILFFEVANPKSLDYVSQLRASAAADDPPSKP